MDTVKESLLVYFENPFWVGVFEREENGNLSVSKVTFGAEPKDYEVNQFVLERYYQLRFSPSVECFVAKEKVHINPKRLQREAKKQVESVGIGTKSQQALKLMQEQGKVERIKKSREQREAEKQFQFDLKQQKRKEKHRGR